MASIGDARGRIIIDSSGAVRGFDKATQSMGGFLKKTAAVAGIAGAGAAISNLGRDVLGFQTVMKETEAISGANARELGQLAQQAKRFGADSQYGARGARSIAEAQTALAKSGLDVKQIYSALPGVMNLAAAGDMQVAAAADAASNASKMFGIEAKDLAGIADKLATAANVTTADVSDFVEATESGGAAAKTAGMNYDQFILSMTALAESSVQGSEAGTSFRSAMAQIANPTAAAQKEMKRLNLSFFDAQGKMRDVKDISRDLNRAYADQTQQQRLASMQTIAGTYGYRTLFALWDQGPGKLAKLERALSEQGSAADVARTKNATAAVAWRGFYQEIVNGAISLGDKALPLITDIGNDAAQFVRDLSAGEGAAGEVFYSIGEAAMSVAPVLGDIIGLGGEVTSTILGIAAPVVGLTAAFAGTSAGATLLKVAVIGVTTAFIAGKAAAVGFFVVQKAGAIISSATAFVQLASGVRSVSQAYGLLQAATMATPIGMIAAGVGIAVTAVTLLTSAFSSGPSASERYKDALDKVGNSAQTMASALDAARNAVSSITGAQAASAQSILTVRAAQKAYNDAVAAHGKGSAEARAAEANLRAEQENRRQTMLRLNEVNGRSKQAIAESITQATDQIRKDRDLVAASGENVKALQLRNAWLQRSGGLTREQTAELEQAVLAHAKHGRAVTDGNASLAKFQREAGAAAKAIKGTSPAAEEARAALMAIADADPKDLPKVVASVQAGTSKATAAAKTGAANTRAALQNVDVTINLSSFTSSIQAGVNVAASIAAAGAARVRGALSTANADVRNSPSANDLLRTSLRNSQGIIRAEGARTAGEVDRQGSIIRESMAKAATSSANAWRKAWSDGNVKVDRVNLISAQLDAAQNAAPTKPGKGASKKAIDEWRKSYAEWVRNQRPALISSIQTGFGDLASSARDAVSMVGQAMDRELDGIITMLDARLTTATGEAEARYSALITSIDTSVESARIGEIDAYLAQASDARRVADEAARRSEATGKVTDAEGQVTRLQAVLARARTESERQAATTLLNDAIAARTAAQAELTELEAGFSEAALQRERDSLANLLQARRDAAQAELDQARQAAQVAYDQDRAAAEQRIAAQKEALERQANDLVYQLERGKITTKAFQKEMTNLLGGPAIVKTMKLSGQTLGLAFANGLNDARADITKSVAGIAKLVTRYLKLNSPAETGPLAFDFTRSGRTLGMDFARGMAASRSFVAREAARVATAANPAATSTSTAAAGGGGFHQTNHIRVDGHVDPRQLTEQMSYAGRYRTTFPGSD